MNFLGLRDTPVFFLFLAMLVQSLAMRADVLTCVTCGVGVCGTFFAARLTFLRHEKLVVKRTRAVRAFNRLRLNFPDDKRLDVIGAALDEISYGD